MYKTLSAFTDKFDKIQISRPLLTFEDDYKACCDIVMKYAPAPKEETALVFMGHGTAHYANASPLSAGKYLPCIGTRACLCRYGRRISKS